MREKEREKERERERERVREKDGEGRLPASEQPDKKIKAHERKKAEDFDFRSSKN